MLVSQLYYASNTVGSLLLKILIHHTHSSINWITYFVCYSMLTQSSQMERKEYTLNPLIELDAI